MPVYIYEYIYMTCELAHLRRQFRDVVADQRELRDVGEHADRGGELRDLVRVEFERLQRLHPARVCVIERVCLSVSVCVFVCVRDREKERERESV